jgi:hypothetical protein
VLQQVKADGRQALRGLQLPGLAPLRMGNQVLVRNKSFGALTGLLSNFRIRCVYIQKDDMASLCFCFCLMEVVFGQAPSSEDQ